MNKSNVSSEKRISVSELAMLLQPITGSTVVSVVYLVDDSKSRMSGGKYLLQKLVSVGNLYLNHDYAKKVQNLSGDKTFEAFEMKGKERISSTLVRSLKTNELLLDGKILAKECREVLNYYHNGEVITRDDAKRLNYFKPEVQKSFSGRGLLTEENDFQMITLALKNIKGIKLFGTTYIVE